MNKVAHRNFLVNNFLFTFCGIILITSGCTWVPIPTTNRCESYAVESIKDDVQKEETTEPQLTMPGLYRLEAPKAKSSFVVYVPADYTPDRAWPVIFCYHGAGGSATICPFWHITQGKGFIIVGMNYMTPSNVHLGLQRASQEKAFFDEALAIVSSRWIGDGSRAKRI
jgi:predicted peptidase